MAARISTKIARWYLPLALGLSLLPSILFSDTLSAIRNRAEHGDILSQVMLGTVYLKGKGVKRDVVEAVKWYRKAADAGNADAQYALGQIYNRGEGVDRNDVEAAKWYQKAADAHNLDAQFTLGVMYLRGRGVRQSAAEATRLFSGAAEAGNVPSQAILGGLYMNGNQVVLPDNIEAYKWLLLAEKHGYLAAQSGIAQLELLMSPAQIAEAKHRAAVWRPRVINIPHKP